MIAHTLSNHTVLYFTTAELEAYGFSPDALTEQEATVLLHQSLPLTGQLPPFAPQMQLFATAEGVLLFWHALPLISPPLSPHLPS